MKYKRLNTFYHNDILEKYASNSTKLVTLRQLTVFGRRLTKEKLLKSANYLRNELPVRIAHRIIDFQQLPFIVGTNPHVQNIYELYWEAFEKFRQIPEIQSFEDNEHFCSLVRGMLKNHLVVIPQLGIGMAECGEYMPSNDMERFVTETLRSRIGRRVLAEQHLALSDSWDAHEGDHDLGRWIGIIDTKCHAAKTVIKCAEKARLHVSKITGLDPPLVHVDGNIDAEFLYIPDHIEYILVELIKNSMISTLSHHKTAGKPSPITITIGNWTSSILFRVSDRGGGLKNPDTAFSFTHSSQSHIKQLEQTFNLAGTVDELDALTFPEGLGLSMSRIYANYWNGDISLYNMDNFGTDMYVSCSVGNELENLNYPIECSK